MLSLVVAVTTLLVPTPLPIALARANPHEGGVIQMHNPDRSLTFVSGPDRATLFFSGDDLVHLCSQSTDVYFWTMCRVSLFQYSSDISVALPQDQWFQFFSFAWDDDTERM